MWTSGNVYLLRSRGTWESFRAHTHLQCVKEESLCSSVVCSGYKWCLSRSITMSTKVRKYNFQVGWNWDISVDLMEWITYTWSLAAWPTVLEFINCGKKHQIFQSCASQQHECCCPLQCPWAVVVHWNSSLNCPEGAMEKSNIFFNVWTTRNMYHDNFLHSLKLTFFFVCL